MRYLNNKKMKAKTWIKKNNLLFFIFICYRDISKLTMLSQRLKNKNFTLLSGSKTLVEKTFESSIYFNFKALKDQTFILRGFMFYLVLLRTDLELLQPQLLAFKLNRNIYNKRQLKNICSFCYKHNKLLLFKFISANLKVWSK